MTTKTYSRRDSATSALRKMGIDKKDYDKFITKVAGGVLCELGSAQLHLNNAKPKSEKSKEKAKKGGKKTSSRRTVSSVIRGLIEDGLSNKEIWEKVKSEFKLDDAKRSYPAWYRSEMRRKDLAAE